MSLRAAIQRADLASEELGELSIEAIFSRLTGTSWDEDFRLFAERWLQGQQCCPPGLYLYRVTEECLACYPVSQGRFLLNFCLTTGRGFFGRKRSKEFAVAPATPEKAEELIRVFASSSSEDIVDTVSQETLVRGGIIG